MYVTDVPVIDRLADPAMREVDTASDSLETALYDLRGWVEELDADDVAFKPAEIHKGLSDALDAAMAGFDHAMDALDLAGLPTL